MDDVKRLEFLRQLALEGDKANMCSAGEAVGLDRAASEALGMDLMAQGVLEMVSLGGRVALTTSGQSELDGAPGPEKSAELAALLDQIAAAGGLGLEAAIASNLQADLATLQAALKRNPPLAPVLEACLQAMDAALGQAGGAGAELKTKLAPFLS
jgi:hypothetical protein